MKEDTIRPLQLKRDNIRLEQEDASRMLRNASSFVEVPCPACGGGFSTFSFKKLGYQFRECQICYTLFVSPRPTQYLLHQHYMSASNVKHWSDSLMPAVEESRREEIFRPRARRVCDLVKAHHISCKNIWDVGAGTGVLCEEIGKLKVFDQVQAVEINSASVQKCIERGVQIHQATLERIGFSDCVDVMVGFEIIEHVFSPEEFINVCHRLLRPGGMLILSTPNIRGFDMAVLRERSENIMAPTHLNYFCPSSLSSLLSRCGFDILEVSTPGQLDVDIVRNMTRKNELPNFLKLILFDIWSEEWGDTLQRFLSDNLLSSHMQIVARSQ